MSKELGQDVVIKMPLFDEAAQKIKETGSYSRELSAQELAGIMSGIVNGLTSGQEAMKATVPTMNVKIEKAKGMVAGSVRVAKPIQATINVNCTLGNDVRPNRLKLDGLNIQTEAGFAAKMALKAVNLEGKAKEALQDPNQALGLALASQLEPRGVKLTGVGLHFNETNLAVSLTGTSIVVRR